MVDSYAARSRHQGFIEVTYSAPPPTPVRVSTPGLAACSARKSGKKTAKAKAGPRPPQTPSRIPDPSATRAAAAAATPRRHVSQLEIAEEKIATLSAALEKEKEKRRFIKERYYDLLERHEHLKAELSALVGMYT
ncbi:hypothetical protein H2203_005676 [Taxawa tesnikishii (nom. ined.)]|nr:hypothetical protein H2203_005676 [Dothideales sp. JES 119]